MDIDATPVDVTFDSAVLALTDDVPVDNTATATPSDPDKELRDVLQTYKVVDEAATEMKADNFETMRSLLSRFTSRPAAEDFLTRNETAWVEGSYPTDKIKRTKAGKIKNFTELLPGPYSSAKSVLLSAIENGIAFYDADGEPIGKTAMQGKNKEASKTPEEKIAAMLDSIFKVLPQCADMGGMAEAIIHRVKAFIPETGTVTDAD